MADNIRLASTQHRDVQVTIGGKLIGIAQKHNPGRVKNNAKQHYPGGGTKWKILTGRKVEMEEGELTFTFDPDVDFALLDTLTTSVAENDTIEIVDTYLSPGKNVIGSRKYAGVVAEVGDPESSSEDVDAMEITISYIPAGLPTS